MSNSALSKRRSREIFRRRLVVLSIVVIAIAGCLVISYAWDYRPQTLTDVTIPIKEQYLQQVSVDLSFGDRNVEIAVETYALPVYVTLWWQSGTSALIYLKNQPVTVNSTWTTSVTLHNSGGQYSFLVSKNEVYGEGLTTIHVSITI